MNKSKVEPWKCSKCGGTAYVHPDLHAYVCSLYRKGELGVQNRQGEEREKVMDHMVGAIPIVLFCAVLGAVAWREYLMNRRPRA